jgi:hypothetical protein
MPPISITTGSKNVFVSLNKSTIFFISAYIRTKRHDTPRAAIGVWRHK